MSAKRAETAYYCPDCGGLVHWGGFYRCTDCGHHIEMGQLVTRSEVAARIRAERTEGMTCDPLF